MIPFLLPAVAALSAYATNLSVRSIMNMRTYEEKSKKAAKWLGAAEDQLWQTRKTEAAGLLAVSPPPDARVERDKRDERDGCDERDGVDDERDEGHQRDEGEASPHIAQKDVLDDLFSIVAPVSRASSTCVFEQAYSNGNNHDDFSIRTSHKATTQVSLTQFYLSA